MNEALATHLHGHASAGVAPVVVAGHREPVQLAVPGERPCARPACHGSAVATLSFSYAARQVELQSLTDAPQPQTYDLCPAHASRTRPPHGWELRDRRPADSRQPDERRSVPADLGGDRTVAVLAAALRAVPDAVSEDAAGPTAGAPAAVRP